MPDKTKVLVTGPGGLLGSEIFSMLSRNDDRFEVYGLSRKRPQFLETARHIAADIGDFETVYSKATALNPDIIINTAAVSGVDDCERDTNAAYRINALGARNVAEAARRFDAYLIHISTDYVFGGISPRKPDGYGEFEEPSPVNEYGRTKLWGEKLITASGAKHCIIRTSWIFGPARGNYVYSAARDKEVTAADDMTSSPTNARDLAAAVKILVEKSKNSAARGGIYHLCNSGAASRYEIAVFVTETLGLSKNRIKKVAMQELALPAERPEFSALKSVLWEADGFAPLRPWREAVSDYLSGVIS